MIIRLWTRTSRLQSQASRVRPPRRQQQNAKNPLRQIQATLTTANEYTEVHTDLSEQELRRLKRAQSKNTDGEKNEVVFRLLDILLYTAANEIDILIFTNKINMKSEMY